MRDDDSYYKTIADLRQARHQREAEQRINEIVTEHSDAVQPRDEGVQSGDHENADYWDAECERLENEFATLQQPKQELSETKQRWLAERWDLPPHA
jgi:hypothetical protein